MTCARESKPNVSDLTPATPTLDIYRVGGSLRDELLGRPHADQDFVVLHSSDQELRQAFPAARRVGHRHGAVYFVHGAEYSLSRHPDIRSDLKARDLTINALAEDQHGRMHALDQTWEDLRHKVLRQVRDANFFQDPLRVFRTARLASSLPGFTVAPELEALLVRVGQASRLDGLSPERVGQETIKACRGSQPGHFLRLLARTGTLRPWFQELALADSVPAGPPGAHGHFLLEHTARVMDALAGHELQVWMGLCHDLGKTLTPQSRWPRHHDHDQAGVGLALRLAERLRLPRSFALAGQRAARWHMVAGNYDLLRPGTKVDLLRNLRTRENIRDLFSLVKADQDRDHTLSALQDLDTLLSVKLPAEHRNLGRRSGVVLRGLQAQALISSSRKRGRSHALSARIQGKQP